MDMNFDTILQRAQQLSLPDCEILWRTAEVVKPKLIVEIGAMYGTSSMLFATLAKQTDGHLYSIEPAPTEKWHANMEALQLKDYVTLINAPSPWIDPDILPHEIDYLFIDGEHRTRWCLMDYHYWEPFVRPGGRIAFHDYTGRKGEGKHIKRAIDMILETDALVEVDRSEAIAGVIVFEKPLDVKDMYGHSILRNSYSQAFYEPKEAKQNG